MFSLISKLFCRNEVKATHVDVTTALPQTAKVVRMYDVYAVVVERGAFVVQRRNIRIGIVYAVNMQEAQQKVAQQYADAMAYAEARIDQ